MRRLPVVVAALCCLLSTPTVAFRASPLASPAGRPSPMLHHGLPSSSSPILQSLGRPLPPLLVSARRTRTAVSHRRWWPRRAEKTTCGDDDNDDDTARRLCERLGRDAKRPLRCCLPWFLLLLGTTTANAVLFGAPAPAAALPTPEVLSASTVAGLDASTAQVFLQATSLIFLSEIGDKTFFIASILAARASRVLAFVGAFGALVLMTGISVAIGQIFHSVPDTFAFTKGYPIDDYVAIASFVYFGVKSILDALANDDSDGLEDELKEAEAELSKKGDVVSRAKGLSLAGEAFALTVAAEIGDRSQIATIALSAAQNPYVVAVGACFGHGLATGIAVLGGAFISKYVSEKGISLIAGVLFLLFAATTALGVF